VVLEQAAQQGHLLKHHGLNRIFCEGLTANDLPNYKGRITVLRAMDPPAARRIVEPRRTTSGPGHPRGTAL
jgi:hypothetical protein